MSTHPPLDLPALIALEAAATPSPWVAARGLIYAIGSNAGRQCVNRIAMPVQAGWNEGERTSDAEIDATTYFVQRLRNAAPALLAAAQERDALRAEVARQLAERDEARRLLGRIDLWANTYGAALKPGAGSTDSYGDGMRAAKGQIKQMVAALGSAK